jgi:hypothetical protein
MLESSPWLAMHFIELEQQERRQLTSGKTPGLPRAA